MDDVNVIKGKTPSDLQTDLEAQKLILSKLENECKKNFLDDKSLNETLGQYKMAAQDLKNSINDFLVSKNVNVDSNDKPETDDRPLDEELKEKIDLLEATLKSSGVTIKESSSNANGSAGSQQQPGKSDNNTAPATTLVSVATSTTAKAAKNDDQPKQQSTPSNQPKSPVTTQPQQLSQSQSPIQSPSPQAQEPEKRVVKSKKESTNKKSIQSDADSIKIDSQSELATDNDKQVNVNVNQNIAPKDSESSSASPGKKLLKATLNKRSAHKEKSTIEHILKNLNSDNDEENQLKLLCKMYIDLMEDNRALEKGAKQNEKTYAKLSKEKEQLQSENNRLILAKSRLESLCRELQKHNKAIKEESLLRIKEEEEKHRSIAAKFQATLSEIMVLVQESQQRNIALREENVQYEKKLRIYLEHYDKWEKEIEKILASKDLEIQLIKTKLAEANLTSDHEREKLIEEKQQILNMISDLHKKHSESLSNESHLKAQLSLYISKYDEFQTILAKSNEMFNGFKKDMEKMAKQIKELEKETIRWKKKWEESNKALSSANEERKTSAAKIAKLENLCRALQADRNQLSEKLKKYEVNNNKAESLNDEKEKSLPEEDPKVVNSENSSLPDSELTNQSEATLNQS